ncbi:nuclease-related domain-containing protein [Domibacillus robiginosus]|uniref:nuclease-related domain-containing protein n=1 Tax=Domibacillus robiginosus TaxID=1071054 RepID=UPI00067CBAAF|nr:nuclease-related domain-containing protein [Domibacillus robiginosus]
MKKSLWHRKLEVLESRLNPAAPQYPSVKEELRKCMAGMEGEKRLYYFLSELNESFRLLHDIRLPSPNGVTHFQMDTVVVSPSVIFIFEVKHLTGHLIFNRYTNQLIRGNQTFSDPITQVHRQKRALEQWLVKPVPILPAVVVSHPNARVDIIPPDSADREFIVYPMEITSLVDAKINGRSPLLTAKEVHEISGALLKHHRPYDPGILKTFNIHPDQIQTGIRCTACKTFTVTKINKKWTCASCGSYFKTAHLAALQEYVLLFGPKITNSDLRAFLKIESRSITEKLLKKWRVDFEGTTRNYVHILPDADKQ